MGELTEMRVIVYIRWTLDPMSVTVSELTLEKQCFKTSLTGGRRGDYIYACRSINTSGGCTVLLSCGGKNTRREEGQFTKHLFILFEL